MWYYYLYSITVYMCNIYSKWQYLRGVLVMNKNLRVGIDVGSTTVKVVVLNDTDDVIFSKYTRHYSDIKLTTINVLKEAYDKIKNNNVKVNVTGSGGLEIADILNVEFIQEVIACTNTVEKYINDTDVAIELGGEDAKITYFGSTLEQRMNGTCAGGTGAFIDQMASLLETDATGLNELAKGHKIIYPIASRCGVFAKTDIQPLINEGAAKEDIAASIFQAVVNQTIGGLACGKPIKGKVAFLGGPLYFLSELRARFIETLSLSKENTVLPENSQLFVAMGAALASETAKEENLEELISKLENSDTVIHHDNVLEPLFKDEIEYNEFKSRHEKDKVEFMPIDSYKGNCYLGIDAGSTTTKIVLIDEEGNIIYSFYDNNRGEPLQLVLKEIEKIYDILPSDVNIVYSTVTGYGESLIKNALKIDEGEVETLAHYKGSSRFLDGVEFILDIGGQDMKAIKVKDGIVQSVILNEACSSGCGSFIETFATSLSMNVEEFAQVGIKAKNPVDLGSRCTVFMNSKVKHVQKEGAEIGDISAGLAYSVIKNALYKVIKIKDPEELGKKVIVQGGTFLNDAVLRALEITLGKNVVRPNIAGLMGAYGAALIAKERYQGKKTTLLSKEEISKFSVEKKFTHCGGCGNKCMLTINIFNDGRRFISGNKCEKPLGNSENKLDIPNLYEYKYKKIFDYKPLDEEKCTRGIVGIPRVLNMYEDYPFWHTFFSELGFSVKLSSRSSKVIYEKGIETIPSESVCYPAKMTHGHIMDLIESGVKFIFYPSIPYERKEYENVDNHYNCPIVTSYPEVIKNNIEELRDKDINFKYTFVNLNSKKSIKKQLYKDLCEFNVSKKEVDNAVDIAYEELVRVKNDIQAKGEETLKYIEKNNMKGIVVSGRPYHVDPEINHGLTKIITSEGMAVLTEDSVAHLGELNGHLRVMDQWAYHSRLYRAAAFVRTRKDLELIQLTSFGCGLDAVTSDQVQEILSRGNKIYTLLKIDEGSNLGAIRIRIRSLKAAIKERENGQDNEIVIKKPKERVRFTKEMKKTHKILAPQMSPIHFQLLQPAFNKSGYDVEILQKVEKADIEEGLKYVNNDACYPAIIVIGQMIRALKSGRYDLDNVSLIMTQTGGGCRASNYIAFLRKALSDLHMDQIPVISLNAAGLEGNPGFKITLPMVKRAMMALVYGDLFMNVLYKVRPYEKEKGAANKLYNKWVEKVKVNIEDGNSRVFKDNVRNIVKEFDELELLDIKKPKVGIVGEILVKFHPVANNYAVDIIEKEGGEAVVPELLDFFMYCAENSKFKHSCLDASLLSVFTSDVVIKYLEHHRKIVKEELNKSKRFKAPHTIGELANKAGKIMSLGHQTGEGWFLTGEMMGLLDDGVNNIICMQPFACLPNHVVGKGMIKELRRHYPLANIVPIDYDPGASEVNQLNRIKLMMSAAFKNMDKEQNIDDVISPKDNIDNNQLQGQLS